MSARKPHAQLEKYYQGEAGKQQYLRSLFDLAAPYYEGIAKWGWFGTGGRYRVWALRRAGLRPGMSLLDVAAGTGPTARAAAQILGTDESITCLEPSAGMIAEARKTLSCQFVQAGADAMPLPSDTFDFLSMGFALRHVEDLGGAFAEFLRVLKPGGKALILDETVPKRGCRRFFMKLYFKHILPTFTRVFTRSRPAQEMMDYYWETLENMVEPEAVVQAMREAGFTEVRHQLIAGMFSEYQGVKAP